MKRVRIAVLIVALALVAAGGLSTSNGAAARSAGRSLSLVAIGDSLPYGHYDCGYCATFVDLFGKVLARATGVEVVVKNLSEHTGIDSGDLRRQLVASRAGSAGKPTTASCAGGNANSQTAYHSGRWTRPSL